MLNLIKVPEPARMDRATRVAMSEPMEDKDLTSMASRELMERTVVLKFLEAKILPLALHPKRLDVVTVTRMALDSASRVIVTVNPNTVSSPGW